MKLTLATALLLGTALAGAANADGSDLVVFDWAGYDDPGFYQSYVDAHGSDPLFSFFTDEEEAFQKMRAGFKVDAGHPCSQSVPKWMEAGLLEPVDPSRIPEWANLEPGFRDIEAYWKDGQPYFIPMDWGNTAVTYNTELLSEEDAATLQSFADPKHAGRVSIPDNLDDAYALAFLAIGVKDWTQATDEQFAAASDFLRQVHQNLRAYWTDGASLAQMMQSGEVYLAWAWNETFATMSAEGYPITMKRDTQEGSSSWVCGYVKMADHPASDDLFYDFVNAWLEPASAEYIVSAWGYGHSNAAAMANIAEEDLAAVGLESSEALREGTLWQAPVSPRLREMMIAEFEKIKAGF